jgi:protein gp37
MSDKTHIQWADSSWNVVTGCSKVSPGCKNCYAERHWPRLSGNKATKYHGRKFSDVRCHPEELDTPLRWKKPRRIFVPSMGDLFHPDVPDDFVAAVFGVIAVGGAAEYGMPANPFGLRWNGKHYIEGSGYGPHTFMVLSKRPERARQLLKSPRFRKEVAASAYKFAHNRTDAGYLAHQIGQQSESGRCYPPGRMWPLSNLWLGVSCEDQVTADERIPILLDTPAAHRFLSLEPLIAPIDLRAYTGSMWRCKYCGERNGSWSGSANCVGCRKRNWPPGKYQVDHVIVGAESGLKRRPCNIEWIRSIVEHCEDAGIPVFVKQVHLNNGKLSSNTDEWPDDVRVRENPE